MDDVLDLGEVSVPDWSEGMSPRDYVPFRELMNNGGPRVAFMMHDIKWARSMIRGRREGEYDPMKRYRMDLTWPNGEMATWEFDDRVSWPIEDGVARDWQSDWLELFRGAA